MINELKPVLKTEELELIFEKLEGYVDFEEGDDVHKLLLKLSHSMEPLYEIPEGYQLVPIEIPSVLLRMIYNDVNSRCLAEEFEPSEIAYELYKAFVKAAKEQSK